MPEWWKEKLRGPRPFTRGEQNHQWKGEKIGYSMLHRWLCGTYGNPPMCEKCGKKGAKTGKNQRWDIVWALKRGLSYKRDVKSFLGLCRSCHGKYDIKLLTGLDRTGKSPWNKGKKGAQEFTKERNAKISATLKKIGHCPQKFQKTSE